MRWRRRRTVTFLAWAAAASLAPSAPVQGQRAPSPGDTLELTLERALEIAELHNPGHRRALNELELSAPERRSTLFGQVLPSVRLNLLNTSYSGYLTRRSVDFFGRPIENPDADFVYSSSTQQGASLSWTLQGRRFLDRWALQGERERGRVIGGDASGWSVRSLVRRRFFDALAERELLEVERALALARETDVELARRLFSLAAGSQVDVLSAELEIQRQALAVRQQEGRREQAALALRTALGDPELPSVRLADTPLPLFDPAALDPDAVVALALEAAPAVRLATSGERLARVGLREQGSLWWPSLNVAFSVGRFSQAQEGGALFDLGGFGQNLQSQFQLGMSVPVFNGWFENRLSTRQAEVEAANREEDLRQVRLEVEEAVRGALVALANQYETVRLAERALDLAGRALELAREEYKLGARSFGELQNQIRQEAETRRQVIQARYGFMDALVTLEEAAGVAVGEGHEGSGGGP